MAIKIEQPAEPQLRRQAWETIKSIVRNAKLTEDERDGANQCMIILADACNQCDEAAELAAAKELIDKQLIEEAEEAARKALDSGEESPGDEALVYPLPQELSENGTEHSGLGEQV